MSDRETDHRLRELSARVESLEKTVERLLRAQHQVRVVEGRFTCCGALTIQTHHFGCPVVKRS
jgi:hypothetical protein